MLKTTLISRQLWVFCIRLVFYLFTLISVFSSKLDSFLFTNLRFPLLFVFLVIRTLTSLCWTSWLLVVWMSLVYEYMTIPSNTVYCSSMCMTGQNFTFFCTAYTGFKIRILSSVRVLLRIFVAICYNHLKHCCNGKYCFAKALGLWFYCSFFDIFPKKFNSWTPLEVVESLQLLCWFSLSHFVSHS